MTDEETVRRGQEASRALQYLAPVLDRMSSDAMFALLNAPADALVERQAYAKALAEVKKTIEGHVRDGEYAARVAS